MAIPYGYHLSTPQLIYGYHRTTIGLPYTYHAATIDLRYGHHTATIRYPMTVLRLQYGSAATLRLRYYYHTATLRLPCAYPVPAIPFLRLPYANLTPILHLPYE